MVVTSLSSAKRDQDPIDLELDLCIERDALLDAIDRLTSAVDRLSNVVEALGDATNLRYTPSKEFDERLVEEKRMAEMIGIKRRTLGDYRRQGRLSGCWIKNGRRVRWHVQETLSAWKRGIS